MLHLHFRHIDGGHEGYLLTDEHAEMPAAIRDRDVARADALAHAHTRQFRDSFIAFVKRNCPQGATGVVRPGGLTEEDAPAARSRAAAGVLSAAVSLSGSQQA